ncbi:MAG: S8 family peptidase [Sneathiella sp.]|nr:S8 family peptidase [Sneathiella sp.]
MGGGSAPRIREEHGARILSEMRAAFVDADSERPTDERLEAPEGIFLEVDLRKGANPESVLERKKDEVRTGASQKVDDEQTRVALFVPDKSREVVESIIDEYTNGPLTEGNKPPRQGKVEPIEAVRRARIETFWTDDATALPQDAHDEIWWEVWCFKGMEAQVKDAALSLECIVSEEHYWLHFPDASVIQIRAQRVDIELLLFATSGIGELRRASATPVYFLDSDPDEQIEWVENLAERTVWPNGDAAAVCLLDTGVNRAHMLIEPALATDDALAINTAWGVSDDRGHGTGMAGLALFGDLQPVLEDGREIGLTHRLESVKILPPQGFPANDPSSYGSITQSATALAEVNNAERARVFCLSVTNENVSGARATTWSAAIDQAAVGTMPGDEEEAPNRLFVVSAGNIPSEIDTSRVIRNEDAPIEDPAQSWNALTVGGFTNKTTIDDQGYEDWGAMADAGDISPFSRTSVTWPQGRSPLKPEVVFEAGNRALSPSGEEALDLESLALLTTAEDDNDPLRPFSATSAAAAQGSRMAAMLKSAYPDYWPETIRALIVHSAEWTPNMIDQLNGVDRMTDRYDMLRKFGHGVPSIERAVASAENHLALVSQNEITPFSVVKGQKKFGDCHFYKLPLPKDILEELGEQDVRLKVTLSYFVEPNPGRYASIDAQRYQSFGLRFDLKRRLETERDFVERLNALERDDPLGAGPAGGDNTGWRFGPNSISCGSLHCDEWVGPAVQLAARDVIGIKPVSGWWRDSAKNARRSSRYSLILTLSAPGQQIDLHTPISNIVENRTEVEIEFD